jgi:ABC-type nickel/cobalt efflux system permease component RcnA
MIRKINVDVVAFVLAIALGLAVVLLMSAVIINVSEHQTPTQTLGENATQVIVAIIGGIIGVLGGYIGARVRDGRNIDDK